MSNYSYTPGYFSNYLSRMRQNVTNAYRKGVDIVFHDVAKTAAMNGIDCPYSGQEGVTFLRPTTSPTGYYNVLKYICKHGEIKRGDIYKHFNVALTNTLQRLIDGKLVTNDNGIIKPTTLGKCYIETVQPHYLCKRASKRTYTKEYYAAILEAKRLYNRKYGKYYRNDKKSA